MHTRPSKGLTLMGFDSLVGQYRHRIYGYARHYLGNADDAADVTQEVLIKMWNSRDKLDEERLLAWLLRVTRNACVDSVRRRTAYRKRVATSTEVVEIQTDSDPSPERQASSKIFQEHLRKALETLDEPYKSIVILREIEDFKYEEISGALDLPLNTVKVYLHRARKALRLELSKVLEHDYA